MISSQRLSDKCFEALVSSLVLRLALPARIRLPSKRLLYHQIARTRRERGERSKCRRNSSLHENRGQPIRTKCRNSRDNSHAREGNVRYLVRGGESRIRTMNLAGRIHLKNRMNSASCAPETRADVMRRRSGLLAASFGPERARPI
jgi:hypothetical protein